MEAYLLIGVMFGSSGYDFYNLKSSGKKTTECLKSAIYTFCFNLILLVVLALVFSSLTIFSSEKSMAIWAIILVAAINFLRFKGRKK